MAENETPDETPDAGPAPAAEQAAQPAPEPVHEQAPEQAPATDPRPRLRDRAFSFRAVLAVAVATLLIGGAGGAAIVAVTDDDHGRDHQRMGRFGDGPPGPGRDGFGPRGGYEGPRGAFPDGPPRDRLQEWPQDPEGSAG